MSTAGRALPTKATIAVNKWLEASKFNKFHFVVFLLCLVLMTMDGYDLFVYGAAIPLLMKAFGMTPAQAGAIGSAASIGTLVGALVFGPLADKVGRKTTIIACIVLCCASMGMSGLTHGAAGFGFWRFMFGVGNGGMVPNIMALASEYVPGRNRAMMVAGISSGVQVGGMFGALMGMWAFPHYGWRAVFLLAALPIVLIPVYSKFLPESTTHLAKRNRLDQLRRFMNKARPNEKFADDAVLEVDAGSEKVPLKAVFEEHRAFSTVVFWIVYGVNLYVIYGFTIWLPKLMMNHGFSLTSGLTFMLMLSISSIVGSFIAGRIADRIGARRAALCLIPDSVHLRCAGGILAKLHASDDPGQPGRNRIQRRAKRHQWLYPSLLPALHAVYGYGVQLRIWAPGRHLWTGADRLADVDAFLLRGDANRFGVAKPDQYRWHPCDSGEVQFRTPACNSGGYKCCKWRMRILHAPVPSRTLAPTAVTASFPQEPFSRGIDAWPEFNRPHPQRFGEHAYVLDFFEMVDIGNDVAGSCLAQHRIGELSEFVLQGGP